MILITGGGGVLGTALSAQLTADGKPATVLTSATLNLLDRERTIELFHALQPRIVYHLAGKVHGLGGNSRFPADMFVDNIRINTNVIEAAHLAGCAKIVAASTVAIYASEAPKPVSEAAIWFGEPHGSERAYGHAKRAMLAQLEAFHSQFGLQFAYPILTNIYGPNDRFDAVNGHVLPSLISKFHRAAVEGGGVEVWGTGAAERDFIAAHDAARALILIADQHHGPINVVTGEVVTIRAVTGMLCSITGVREVNWDNSKPDGQIERRYNAEKLKALGFVPELPLYDGLSLAYNWYARNTPNVRR